MEKRFPLKPIPAAIIVFLFFLLPVVSATPLSLTIISPETENGKPVFTVKAGEMLTIPVTAAVAVPPGTEIPVTFEADSPAVTAPEYFTDLTSTRTDVCIANPLCTLNLVIRTYRADIDSSIFPETLTEPGSYPLRISATLPNGDPAVLDAVLKVVSGDLRFDLYSKSKEKWTNDINVVRGADPVPFTFILRGFPFDDALPSGLVSVESASPDSRITISVPSVFCSKLAFQGRGGVCQLAGTISAATDASTGRHKVSILLDGEERFTFVVHIISKVIRITEFIPLEFSKGKPQAVCRATVNPQDLPAGTTLANLPEPLFTVSYNDKDQLPIPEQKGKKTGEGVYEAVFPLTTTLKFGNVFKGVCDVSLPVFVWDKTDKKEVEQDLYSTIQFVEDGEHIKCFAQAYHPFAVEQARLLVSVRDKDGGEWKKGDGSPAFAPAVAPKESSAEKRFLKSELMSYVKAGEFFTCQLDVEIYDTKAARKAPTTAPAAVFTIRSSLPFEQECLSFKQPGFGDDPKKTVAFIGFGGTEEEFAEEAKAVASALASHPIYKLYTPNLFLKKLTIPAPDDTAGEGVKRVNDMRKKVWSYRRWCPADFYINIGKYAGGSVAGIAVDLSDMTLYANPADKIIYDIVTLHEAGHLFATLDDEYVYDDPTNHPIESNCIPSTHACEEWIPYQSMYVACYPGCTTPTHYRSAYESIMQKASGKEENRKFSVVQCAYLIEYFEKLKNPSRSIDFDRGMRHCINNVENGNSYDLVRA